MEKEIRESGINRTGTDAQRRGVVWVLVIAGQYRGNN